MERRVLVTGATGYLGGRLVPRLLEAGFRVRCLSRDPRKLRDVPWAGDVEIVRGDVGDADSLAAALADVDLAYYLVHSIGAGDFADLDREGARTFGAAAREAGVQRLVYLGGLTPKGGHLSEHLRSRQEVGRILLDSGVPTIVLQAAVIIGSGGASFEMLRYLTERLPVMLVPKWVQTRTQPIAVRDVLRYLVGAADIPLEVSRRFDIGGPDVMTYEEMMQRYAVAAGLPRRRIIRTPVLSVGLASHWINVVTPVPKTIARPLVESLQNEVVCSEHDIAAYVPDPPEGLLGLDQAIRYALARIESSDVETSWSSATWEGAASDPLPSDPDWTGGSLYVDCRQAVVRSGPQDLWEVIQGIGGENGWYSWPLAWSVRGWLDRLVGGVGLVRGRRDPRSLHVGESLDWWRVEELEPGRLLRLRAEMKAPGDAWLELAVAPAGGDADLGCQDGGVPAAAGPTLVQRAVFRPRGLAGHAYWWGIKPFHFFVFGGMIRNIARAAERSGRTPPPTVDTAAADIPRAA